VRTIDNWLKTGDVVCVNYNTFEGEKVTGIFLIVYSERFDRVYTSGHTNLNCVKITTNNFQGNSYVVRLRKGNANLDKDCLVNLSKVFTFRKEQVFRKLGSLDGKTMLNVFKEMRAFNQEVENQILETTC
jgi:mRNA-degrading endonuclease toxin of MazEF toxin-antitoxin module